MSEVDAAITAARALIAKNEKIEHLEAELAACEQVREAIAAESRDRYGRIVELEAELAECRELLSLNARPVDMARELADLRKQRNEMLQEVTTWRFRAEKSDERLADLRASSVVYKVRCECWDFPGKPGQWMVGGSLEDHPDCDNGWQLAEGVRDRVWWCRVGDRNPDHPIDGVWTGTLGDPQRCWYHGEHDSRCGWAYVIPARLIEGDT